MAVSGLALAAVVIDDRPGTKQIGENSKAELLQRASRDDYYRWLTTALAAGGCVRPIRLRGAIRKG